MPERSSAANPQREQGSCSAPSMRRYEIRFIRITQLAGVVTVLRRALRMAGA